MRHLAPFSPQISNHSSLDIYVTTFEAVKKLYKVHFPILINIRIVKYKIRIIDFGSRTNLHFLSVGQSAHNTIKTIRIACKERAQNSIAITGVSQL